MVGFGMDLQTLLSRTVGSGTLLWLFCRLSCIPRAFGMLQLPWADLCGLVPVALVTLCIWRIWLCITQLTGPDHCKKLSQWVCVLGLSQEQSSWIL